MKVPPFLRRPMWGDLLAGVLAAALSLPILSWPFVHDQCIFATIADEMLRGAVLYRDVWEHKPPGVFCTYALAFLLFGRDLWAVHVVEILAVGLAAAGLMRLGRERLKSWAAGAVAAAAMPLLYLPWKTNTAQPEFFAIPFVVWGFALWPREEEVGRPETRCFASGLLLSAAVLFKTPLLFFPLSAVADRLLLDYRGDTWKKRLGPTGAAVAGIAVLPLLMLAYYTARGAFPEFLDANLHFPSKYAAPSLKGKSFADHREAFHWWTWLVPLTGALLIVAGFVRGLVIRRGETLRWTGFLLAGWAGVVLQAKYWPYHHLILLPGIAAAFGLAFMKDPAAGADGRPLRKVLNRGWLIVASALAFLTAASYLKEVRQEWEGLTAVATRDLAEGRRGSQTGSEAERRMARRLQTIVDPEERMYVWGDKPVLYVLSDRRMAGPYPHLLPVLAWFLGAEGKIRLDALIDRLGRERPRWFVVAPGKLWWYGAHEPREIIGEFPNLRRFLTDCYALQEEQGEYEIWKLRE